MTTFVTGAGVYRHAVCSRPWDATASPIVAEHDGAAQRHRSLPGAERWRIARNGLNRRRRTAGYVWVTHTSSTKAVAGTPRTEQSYPDEVLAYIRRGPVRPA